MDAAPQPFSFDALPLPQPVEPLPSHDVEIRFPVEVGFPSARVAADVALGASPLTGGVVDVIPLDRSELACRVLNVTIALLALVLLSPVFLLIALAVKLTSRGPVFYTQTRVGMDRRWRRTHHLFDRRLKDLGGQIFTIYKFRSMRVDAEPEGRAVWAAKHDSRTTPIGCFLRDTRLDELPQLINVIRGDMNIVGPRPERPCIFQRLREDIPEYSLRQRTRPGITGWAQINQAYDTCLEDVRRKVHYDLEYLQRQSVIEDVRIMAKTVPVMIFRKGAH
jgi:lipopolysaccharide/colanic/teichoic acid biosynthesis glycosyltransferase